MICDAPFTLASLAPTSPTRYSFLCHLGHDTTTHAALCLHARAQRSQSLLRPLLSASAGLPRLLASLFSMVTTPLMSR